MAIILQQISADCLPKASYTSIGFAEADVKASAEKIATPTACKTLFNTDGACVT